MSALSRCPRCGTELHRASETVWVVIFVCPRCHAICIFPPQDPTTDLEDEDDEPYT